MILAAKIGLLLGLLTVDVFSPGFFFVRRLQWSPLEKLCGAIGVSLILLYLVSSVLYGLGPQDWALPCWAVSVICLALLLLAIRDLRKLAAGISVRQIVFGFAFLLLWTLSILSMIRHYSGGGWAVDWLEHFQRTLFFLHRFPTDTPIFSEYQLAARPPMMNLLGAFFLAQTGDRFELFQVAFMFLNLLVFLSCCLIAPALGPGGRRRIVPLVALFALSPLVMQNATYTWTKLLAGFYVILALWFYVRGWRKHDKSRVIAAFAFLAAGLLVHYSTGPYLVFVALHYIFVLFRQRDDKWRELAAVVGLSGMLLVTWIGWSIAVYGARSTFTSNTSLTPSQTVEGGALTKIGANVFDTIVPHSFRSDAPPEMYRQPNALGEFRDYFFLMYQTNAIFGMGAIGGPVVVYLLYRAFRKRRDRDERERSRQRFWLAFVTFCVVVGVAVHGERDAYGVAHVTLQPLMVLGLALLARSVVRLPRVAARLVVAGCAVDFAVGVLPQIWVESLENGFGRTVFAGLTVQGGQVMLGQAQHDSLSRSAWSSWLAKHQFAACGDWSQEVSRLVGLGQVDGTANRLLAFFEQCRSQDAVSWHGWYARNGGVVTFLGDRVVGSWTGGMALPLAAVVAMFLALMTALLLYSQSAPMSCRPREIRGKK